MAIGSEKSFQAASLFAQASCFCLNYFGRKKQSICGRPFAPKARMSTNQERHTLTHTQTKPKPKANGNDDSNNEQL